MYLGIDFLLRPPLDPVVIEVNVGLPGGAEEYERAFRSLHGRAPGVFDRIEDIALREYGRPFREYLGGLPFLPALKEMKLWMDGKAPSPSAFHPALRLEDKWVQYQILKDLVPMPETMILGPEYIASAETLLQRRGRLACKLRSGRGGRGFFRIDSVEALRAAAVDGTPRIVQEWIESRVDRFHFSIRAVAFGGRYVCAYANLAQREYSNHSIIAVVEEGGRFGLEPERFLTRLFDAPSWEGVLWFGEEEPPYLYHNLRQDEAAEAALLLPASVFSAIKATAVRIEQHYESLDWEKLPAAWFENGDFHTPEI